MSSEKICFIASTIGEENSEERKNADDKFDLVFKPVLDEMGYEAIRADKIGTPNSISNDIVKAILESELMVADVSDLNPNVFYELAVRNAIQKPVIIIKGKNQKMPFDIYDKRAISLDMQDARLWITAKELLKKQIIQSQKDKKSASESILSNFSLKTDLQSSINPSVGISLELKDLQSEIRRLREDVRERKMEQEFEDIMRDSFQRPNDPDLSIIMDILKDLEGKDRKAVKEDELVKSLVKTKKFNRVSAISKIRQLMREASIYESKPGHYNRV